MPQFIVMLSVVILNVLILRVMAPFSPVFRQARVTFHKDKTRTEVFPGIKHASLLRKFFLDRQVPRFLPKDKISAEM